MANHINFKTLVYLYIYEFLYIYLLINIYMYWNIYPHFYFIYWII
jgi:hypothetical protein